MPHAKGITVSLCMCMRLCSGDGYVYMGESMCCEYINVCESVYGHMCECMGVFKRVTLCRWVAQFLSFCHFFLSPHLVKLIILTSV